MPRTLNPAAHTVKREVFVEAGMRLMQTRGYEQASIQDLLDEVGASRGAFYHYFDSKQALLEAMVDRIADQALAALAPLVEDPRLAAVPKLQRFFAGVAQWKTDRKALMLELIKVWTSDDNAVVREKVRRTLVERVAPIVGRIVEQGVAEEVFSVDSPAATGTVLMMLMTSLQDEATQLFLARQANAIPYEQVEKKFTGYAQAFERILGAPTGSIQMVDRKTLQEWFG